MSQFSLLRLRRFHQIKFAPLSFSPSTTQFSHWMCDITDMYGTTCFYPGQALTSVSINIIPLRTSGFFLVCQEKTPLQKLYFKHIKEYKAKLLEEHPSLPRRKALEEARRVSNAQHHVHSISERQSASNQPCCASHHCL